MGSLSSAPRPVQAGKSAAEAISQALRLILEPGQVTELRALDAVTPADRRPHVEAGYFDDAEKLARAAVSIKQAKGIYFVLNPVNPALLARAVNKVRPAPKGESTGDGDILCRRWLPVDADPVRPAGIASSDPEHQAALDRATAIVEALTAEGWPLPIAADSGNGAHLLYRIDLPADDDGLVRRCLQALAARFDDDVVKIDQSVFNPARIWKLYGTTAGKGDAAAAAIGRPHRLARILAAPETPEVVPRQRLEALAASLPAQPRDRPAGRTEPRASGQTWDLERWLQEHHVPVEGGGAWQDRSGQSGRRWVFPVCPWNSEHTNGSAFVIQFANGALAAGCHHNGCGGKDWHALRDVFEPGWRVPRTGRTAAAHEGNGQAAGNGQHGTAWEAPAAGSGAAPSSFPDPIPASALAAVGAETDWIWRGYLARQGVTLLTSLWKAGKSTLLAHLVKAMGRGEALAGLSVAAGKVLVVSEESAALWAGRRDRLDIGDHALFYVRPFLGRPTPLAWCAFLRHLAGLVRERDVALVCLDTLAALSPCDDENDAAKMMAALQPLHHITEAGAGVLLSHHPRKGDAGEGQASRGSGALPGFVDVIVEMRRVRPQERGNRQRELTAYSRFDDTPAELVIELAEDGSGYRSLGAPAEADRQGRWDTLRSLLPEETPGKTAEELLEAWPEDKPKPGKRTLEQDLKHGAEAGRWSMAGAGRKGDPFRFWSNENSIRAPIDPIAARIESDGRGEGEWTA